MANSRKSKQKEGRHRNEESSKYNYPLGESLFLSFIFVLFCGLFLNTTVKFFHDHHLNLNLVTDTDYETWERVPCHGDVLVCRKPVRNKTLYAYKYSIESDLPLQVFVDIANNPELFTKWLVWQVENEILLSDHPIDVVVVNDKEKTMDDQRQALISRMKYDIPYSFLHDREIFSYLTKSSVIKEEEDGRQKTKVSFHYDSFEDEENFPLCNECKKAELNLDISFTTSDGGQTTKIEIENYFDPKSSHLPAFLVNSLNKQWGSLSIHRLVSLAKKKIGKEENTLDLKNVLLTGKVFPLK